MLLSEKNRTVVARVKMRATFLKIALLLAIIEGFCEEIADRQSSLPPLVTCNPSYPYRTMDGSCNNLQNPRFGQSNTIFQRLAPAYYYDGVSAVRQSVSGSPLPSPRLISTTVTINESLPSYEATLLTMQFGQFLDHDLTSTPTAAISAPCCSGGGRTGATTASPLDPECLPISIPANDPVFTNVACMNFVRSTYGLFLDGTTPPNREQVNALTHWIDASQIYGNTDAVAASLRDTSSGKGLMKVSVQNGRNMLPLTNTCTTASCFVAGDSRVTEQPLLTILHTIWLREHNRVANQLFAKFGSSKTDEYYYQEARRIVIAEWQHIVYNEYLRVVMGPVLDIPSPPIGPTNPAVFTEFSTAAFRMGHSQLKSFIRLYEADGSRSNESYFLSNSFFSGARLLSPTFIDNALRGLTQTPVQSVDQCFADDVTSQLFKPPGQSLGLDLVSLNIQRGRDHGLQPYVAIWSAAQQNLMNRTIPIAAINFDSLSFTTPKETILSFKKIYSSVYDVDLYIGGVTESPVVYGPSPNDRTLVGPTFLEIFRRQFENLRRSDRFFYSDLSKPTSFTQNQFNEIKKVSMARIICDNNDGTILNIQPNAFRSPNGANMPVPCSSIPGINFANYFKPQNPPPPPGRK